MFSLIKTDVQNVFKSSCGLDCKILHLMKRKTKWPKIDNRKIIPQDASGPVLNVNCKYGKGKVNIFQCNRILADPDRLQGFKDYELLNNVLVVLPLVEAVSFHDKMKLPPYKIDILPNAVFQFNAAKSLCETNVYT